MITKAQAKKEMLISDLINVRKLIIEAATCLSPEERNQVFLGVWSVKDLLAHLIGWDYTNLVAAKDILAGKLPEFYSEYDHDWKSYNERLIGKYKRDNFEELLNSIQNSHQKLIDYLKTIPAEDLDKDTGVRCQRHKITINGLLRVEINDEKIHHQQIENFRRRDQNIVENG